MTTTRKLIWAFWIFIIGMLLWQFYNYNKGITQDAIDHPKPEHYFFPHTNAAASAHGQTDIHHSGAFVHQAGFIVHRDTPSPGNFTCEVTLKNEGDAAATNVQVHVRPFKGALMGDEDVGNPKPLTDNDPTSQMGQWVTFPDIPAGQTASESVVFLNQGGLKPGSNPDPEIVFESVKPKTRPPPNPEAP
jgi:hypothetical protein